MENVARLYESIQDELYDEVKRTKHFDIIRKIFKDFDFERTMELAN